MIVPPDFLDDWRMGVLVDLLGGDPLAPVYVIRLWSHCQHKRSWSFPDIPASGFKAVCKGVSQHKADAFLDAFVVAGYCARDGEGFSVPSWQALNGQLIAAWHNGSRGGRPTKENPTKTRRLTDKRRGEGKPTPPPADAGAPPQPAPPPPAPAPKPVEAPPPAAAPKAPTPPEKRASGPNLPPPAPSAPPRTSPPPGIDLFGGIPAMAPKKGAKAPGKKSRAELLASVDLPDWMPRDVFEDFVDYRLELETRNRAAACTSAAMKTSLRYFKDCLERGETPRHAYDRISALGWRVPFPDHRNAGSSAGPGVTKRQQDAERGMRLAGMNDQQQKGAFRAAHPSDIEDVEFREPGGAGTVE